MNLSYHARRVLVVALLLLLVLAAAINLPSQALLIPFDNRTQLATAWASLHHFPLSNPLPCSDNCGVSINWHVASDYSGGWSARITVFNWDDFSFPDWFAAVELDKTAAGFEKVYSLNGSTLASVNNTIIMQGNPGLTYLVVEADGANPQTDYRVPGKQQSVISFTKKNIASVNIPGGEEWSVPCPVYFQATIPTSWVRQLSFPSSWPS